MVIEDAAHAAGVDEGDGPAGSLGDAAAFSFYPTKALGGLGDGGGVVTGDAALAEEVRRLRSYGWTEWQGQAERPGFNSRLDELQAAVLRERLAELPAAHARLRELAAVYRGALAGVGALGLPERPPAGEAPWHQFAVTHPVRDQVRQALSQRGVGTAVHYRPIPPDLIAFGSCGAGYPRALALSRRALSLPFDSWVSDRQAADVADALVAACRSSERSEM
jgi:dTDP-4-amino-4,6-dideoxygalactose transaminase